MATGTRKPIDLAARVASRRKARASAESAWRRETFCLPREEARAKAREWFDRFPKAAYMTEDRIPGASFPATGSSSSSAACRPPIERRSVNSGLSRLKAVFRAWPPLSLTIRPHIRASRGGLASEFARCENLGIELIFVQDCA